MTTVISAVVRAAAAAAAGVALTVGFALVLWAVTPAADAAASAAVAGGVLAFASAHFLPTSLGGVAVTIHPLLLTGVVIGIAATAVGRAKAVRGRPLEALHAAVFVVVYTVVIDGVMTWANISEVSGGAALAPAGIAAIGAGAALAFHHTAWQEWWFESVAPWLQTGVRAGLAAVSGMLAAGALVLAIALVTSFPDVIGVTDLTVDTVGAGLGMVLLCAGLLPNAVVAAAGYTTGAGFSIGAGTFSPLATQPVALPGIPLLAATPTSAQTIGALAALACPMLVALLVARIIARDVGARSGRLLACGVAALTSGVLMMALAASAGGGVAGGPWSDSGSPPVLTGALLAGVVFAIASACAVVIPARERPTPQRRARDPHQRTSTPRRTTKGTADDAPSSAASDAPDDGAASASANDHPPTAPGRTDEPLG